MDTTISFKLLLMTCNWGFNASVNESRDLPSEMSEPDADEFETLTELADQQISKATGGSEATTGNQMQANLKATSEPAKRPNLVEVTSKSAERSEATELGDDIPLTHDERKLSLILAGAAIVSVVAWLK